MSQAKFIVGTVVIWLLSACASAPKEADFKYDIGEVVYYKIDNVPMLVDKRVVKKGERQYRVVFKNDYGVLQYATVSESEILISPSGDTE